MTLLVGCAGQPKRITAPSAQSLLGTRAAEERIAVAAVRVHSEDQAVETKSRGSGIPGTDISGPLYPKQAREFLAQDLKDYLNSRFVATPASSIALDLDLKQASCFFRYHITAGRWVPLVNLFAVWHEIKQVVPISFATEVKVALKMPDSPPREFSVFVTKSAQLAGNESEEKLNDTYRMMLEEVRKALFARLDAQLMSLWPNGQLDLTTPATDAANAAALASELDRLEADLFKNRVTREQYDERLKAIRKEPLPSPSSGSSQRSP